MSKISAISPVSSNLVPNGEAAGSPAQTTPTHDAAAGLPSAALYAEGLPSDSVSISTMVLVHGHSVSAQVSYSGGDFVACEPGPPVVSARGSSPASAADRLEDAVNLFG